MTKEPAYSAFSIYIMTNKAILASQANTPEHLTLTTEPMEVFNFEDRAKFIQVVENAMSRPIPMIDMPPPAELVRDDKGFPALKCPGELKHASVDSWDDLEKQSTYYSVDCYSSGYVVQSCGRAQDGSWTDEVALELRLPKEVGAEGIVDAIIKNLPERQKGRMGRLSDRILAEQDNSPAESERLKTEREALFGTASYWAELQPDRSIAQSIEQVMDDGSRGHGHSVSIPGNDDYEELLKVHKLKQPGDASTIFKKFIDGVWTVVEDLD